MRMSIQAMKMIPPSEALSNASVVPTQELVLNGGMSLQQIKNVETAIVGAKNPEDLLTALYWIWDAFDRANVPWFLAKQTAEDALKGLSPAGGKLEIGIRKNEWTSGGRRILDAYITPISETDGLVIYEYAGVPIHMHVYEDSDCIINTNAFMYERESFATPNPFDEYMRTYHAS
jgi:hypothetical protein